MKLVEVLEQYADSRIEIKLVNGEKIEGESLGIGDELVRVDIGNQTRFVVLGHIVSFEVF